MPFAIVKEEEVRGFNRVSVLLWTPASKFKSWGNRYNEVPKPFASIQAARSFIKWELKNLQCQLVEYKLGISAAELIADFKDFAGISTPQMSRTCSRCNCFDEYASEYSGKVYCYKCNPKYNYF